MEIPNTYVAQQATYEFRQSILKNITDLLDSHGIEYVVNEQDNTVLVDHNSIDMNDEQIAKLFDEAYRKALS